MPPMPLMGARCSTSAFRHWLATVNIGLGVFLAGGVMAPVLAAVGWRSVADALYAVYHLTCHQWAFRSFFLFGPNGSAEVAAYSQEQLERAGLDPFGFAGSADLGWKMAFCERDLAIYAGLLAVGILYARRRASFEPLAFKMYALLILPMALDGFTQLFGWRESTWQLRLSTGLVFGIASAWLVLARLDASFGLRPSAEQYSPDAACDPAQVIQAGATTMDPATRTLALAQPGQGQTREPLTARLIPAPAQLDLMDGQLEARAHTSVSQQPPSAAGQQLHTPARQQPTSPTDQHAQTSAGQQPPSLAGQEAQTSAGQQAQTSVSQQPPSLAGQEAQTSADLQSPSPGSRQAQTSAGQQVQTSAGPQAQSSDGQQVLSPATLQLHTPASQQQFPHE